MLLDSDKRILFINRLQEELRNALQIEINRKTEDLSVTGVRTLKGTFVSYWSPINGRPYHLLNLSLWYPQTDVG